MKTGSSSKSPDLSRRRFVTGVAGGSLLLGLGFNPGLGLAAAGRRTMPEVLRGTDFQLDLGSLPVNYTGSKRVATAINGSVPGPVLRWREGDRVSLNVTNHLRHDSSIHWHGMILPSNMDGVPGLSFAGIKPGESYHYEFDVRQSGTYWYHSHSGWQEQTGLYGAIVIDPSGEDPVEYDRDHVILLSDWSDEAPETIYAKLKKMGDYYNRRERTVFDLWRDIREKGVAEAWQERAMWNEMRMSDRDLSDVTGATYTYLMNGNTPDDNFRALFKAGEKVRLRIINGSAMTIFDIRIPGLKMTVVASDGQNIQPVSVDEFRIGVAETYDVIVEPEGNAAYTIFAQNIERSGYARGTLASDMRAVAAVPVMDTPVVLSHRDMGMSMDHAGHGMPARDHAMPGMSAKKPQDHSKHGADNGKAMDHSKHGADTGKAMDYSKHGGDNGKAMNHSMHGADNGKTMDHSGHGIRQVGTGHTGKLGKAGFGSNREIAHAATEYGPGVDMLAESPMSGLADPGIGLREEHQRRTGRRVLSYADIRNLTPTIDRREPTREIELHLTGNMHRYMWSMNGIQFADAEPVLLKHGERVRIVLVNDTMMTHPIHLHGLWSELETGDPDYIPRKHTIIVQPGSRISYLVTADSPGRWAYHCHLMFHMPGMFREVRVTEDVS